MKTEMTTPTGCSPFRAGTGLLGATESGQRVTKENVHTLPPGSVVRLDECGRLIHLHDRLWLYCCDGAWCYDRIERHAHRLPGTLCHIPTNGHLWDARNLLAAPNQDLRPEGPSTRTVSETQTCMNKYEFFCDESYYHFWCVRPVGERRFGHGFHVNGREEAEALAAELTKLESIRSILTKSIDDSDMLDEIEALLKE